MRTHTQARTALHRPARRRSLARMLIAYYRLQARFFVRALAMFRVLPAPITDALLRRLSTRQRDRHLSTDGYLPVDRRLEAGGRR